MNPRDLLTGVWLTLAVHLALATYPVQADSEVLEATPDAVVRALEAAMILSGQEGGDIRLAAWNGVFDRGDGSAWVVLVVEVEGPAILEAAAGDELEVDLHLYALDDRREVGAALSRRVRIDLVRHREELETSGLKVPLFLSLPTGEHLLRLLVRTGEQAFGIRSLEVSVGDGTQADHGTRPPVFPDRSGGWLVAIPSSPRADAATTRPPFVTHHEDFLPAALPILRRGEIPRGLLYLSESTTTQRQLEAILRPAFAETVVRLPVTLRQRSSSSSLQLDILEIELPEVDLPSGLYTAVINFRPGIDTGKSTRPFNLVVTGDTDASFWPQLDLDSPGESRPAAIAGSPTPDPGLVDEEISRHYRQVLTQLANSGFDLARPGLRTLEERFTFGSERLATERLEANEYLVASELSKQGADLLPVLVLHAQSAAAYRAKGKNILTRHSIRLIRRLVDLYLLHRQELEARSAAADLLTEVATGEAEFGNLAGSTLLFEESLASDGQNPAALLGLALVYERHGRYADAIRILESLLAERPDHAEATLRLGVNLARQSHPKRAHTLLSQLASRDVEPWIALLAYQEMGRLALDRERPQQAIEILQEGLENWPSDFNLNVQLAFYLDSTGRPAAAQSVLSALEPSSVGLREPSARWLYHRPPSWSQSGQLEALAIRAQKWLPDLRKALMTSDPIVAQQ